MNNEMTFNLHRIAANRAEEIAKKSVEKMSAPVRWLRGYYSNITGRELSTRQTWSLIEAQTAFFLGIMLIYSKKRRYFGDFLFGIAFLFFALVLARLFLFLNRSGFFLALVLDGLSELFIALKMGREG